MENISVLEGTISFYEVYLKSKYLLAAFLITVTNKAWHGATKQLFSIILKLFCLVLMIIVFSSPLAIMNPAGNENACSSRGLHVSHWPAVNCFVLPAQSHSRLNRGLL